MGAKESKCTCITYEAALKEGKKRKLFGYEKSFLLLFNFVG